MSQGLAVRKRGRALKERYKKKSAVFLMVTDGERVLLQKRKNTGFLDGYYDMTVSGHIEAGEPVTAAMLREAEEECGLVLEPSDIRFFTVIHTNLYDDVYYCFYFVHTLRDGEEIGIREEDKIEELRWFSVDALPDRMPEHNRVAVGNYFSGIPFCELGWTEEESGRKRS